MAQAGSSKYAAINLDDSDEDHVDDNNIGSSKGRMCKRAGPQNEEERESKYSAGIAAEKSVTSAQGSDDGGERDASAPGKTAPFALGDRAAMERERLARQRKRRREAGLPEDEDSVGDDGKNIGATMDMRGPTKAAKRQHDERGRIDLSQSDPASSERQPDAIASMSGKGPPMFWKGAILKSFNVYSPMSPGTPFADYIRPTTPFRANGLKHAIMATYCEDIQWVSAMFPKGRDAPEITMVTLAQDGIKPGVYAPLHPQLPNWVRLVVPRRNLGEYTTMHMKFIMLFYHDRLRLLILSGNLVEYDWSRIENTAFVHDFPRAKSGGEESRSDYYIQMRRVLDSLTVPPAHAAMRDMSLYDMSSECEARIVASLPTTVPITGWPRIQEVGMGRLASLAREILGKRTSIAIEAQGSSMGSYSVRWLQQFHIVCQGGPFNTVLPLPAGAKAQRTWAEATRCRESEKWPPIRLLFPSEYWVKTQSIEGVPGAGTFFGKRDQAVERGFVELLHQPVSIRGNFMMHHKALLALTPDAELLDGQTVADNSAQKAQETEPIVGWAYMGSHNLTQAAWGNISSAKGPGNVVQMSSSNWELGIVVPVRRHDLRESQSSCAGSASLTANIITWKRPVQRYAAGDVPWDQKHHV